MSLPNSWSIEFFSTGIDLPTRTQTIQGVEFKVSLSPFGVPILIRFTSEDPTLSIDFEYASDEPGVRETHDDMVDVYVGMKSARIQRIVVRTRDDDGRPLIDQIRLRLETAAQYVEALPARPTSVAQDNRAMVAGSLRSEAVLEPLGKAG